MKLLDLAAATRSEMSLARAAAVTFIGTTAMVALYFGREVLIPAAIAMLFAFILGPAVTWVRRALPLPLSVAVVVLGALAVAGVLAVLVTTQLAEVAGSLTGYQANLQKKILDIRSLSEGAGPVSRFLAMVASLGHDLAVTAGPAAPPALRVQSGGSDLENLAAFVSPLLHPLLTVGIVVILVVFILLGRDHLGDQFVRLFGRSDVHATSEALGDAAARVARVLSLQLLTNLAYAVVIGGGLFALGMPNAALWGLLAGLLRFVPYVGAVLGAVLPTLIAFAIAPDWLQPVLVLGLIIGCDIVLGQVIEPLLFGESTGITPLALIMSALFWGMLWGPVGLLLSMPLTICLLVLGTHVPHLGFLQVLLGDEPALSPYQQIYRRLIAKAVADASTVALAEIEEKGWEKGLDDGMGRMVVLAEADRAQDRLSAAQVEAIVDGTDEVLDFIAADLAASADDKSAATGEKSAAVGEKSPAADRPAAAVDQSASDADQSASDADQAGRDASAFFRCVGGRGQIDDAAASIIAFALRQSGLGAESRRHAGKVSDPGKEGSVAILLICYASPPSDAIRRYTLRKLTQRGAAGPTRHLVIDYQAPAAQAASVAAAGPAAPTFCGDLAALCRLAAEHAVAVGGRAGSEVAVASP
jgi:predicted PurR-regulated permease PerM